MSINFAWNSRPISRNLREAIKAALAAAPGWAVHRDAMTAARNGDAWHTGNATKAELIDACDALGVEIDAVALNAGDAAPVAAPAAATPSGGALSRFEGRPVADIVGEALGPVAAVLSPSLLQTLQAGVSELAAAATQGPRIVKQVVKVNGDANDANDAPTPTLQGAKTAREYFGLTGREGGAKWARVLDGVRLDTYDGTDAPAVDPWFIWTAETAATYASALADGAALFLAGPAGTGKSEGARQFAALGGRAFVRIAIHRTTEPADLIGQYLPKQGGGFTWKDGPLTRAFRIPGCVILIDEPSFLRPGALAVFQTVLDFGQIYLPTGEVVDRAPGVALIAADNTAGAGDATGRYADTGALSLAFMDRFRTVHICEYLPEARESELVAARVGVDRKIAQHMVQLARVTRSHFDGGKLTAGLTTRRVMAWAANVSRGVPSAIAFNLAIANSADPADLETLRQIEATQGGHDMIDALATGSPWPAQTAQTQTPAGEYASNAFASAPAPSL